MKKGRLEKRPSERPETSHDNNGGEEGLIIPELDRISDLPEPIIHHIMSFLTSTVDVTKVSILSKRFFSLWSSFPVIDFDHNLFTKKQGTFMFDSSKDEFLNLIHRSIRLRNFQNYLTKFRVISDILHDELKHSDDRLDNTIYFAIENSVKDLELDLGFNKYPFPAFFASKSVNVLRLQGFVLDLNQIFPACPKIQSLSLSQCVITNDVKLSSVELKKVEFDCCDRVKSLEMETPNLESFSYNGGEQNNPNSCEINILVCKSLVNLSIENAKITDIWFQDHVSKLFYLETLILSGCKNLEIIRVLNKKLRKFYLTDCSLLKKLEIVTPSLKTIFFGGVNQQRCEINISACKFIKELLLKSVNITNDWLEVQVSAMPDLENLKLASCYELERVEISHLGLQSFELFDCNKLVEVKVDTPELLSFAYRGKVTRFGLMNSRSLCNAILQLTPSSRTSERFYGLRDLLAFFGHCKALTLICESAKELIMPEEIRENMISPLYDLKHLKIQTSLPLKLDSDLVDSLLWLTPHPESLCFASQSIDKVMKFEYEKMIKKCVDPFCCRDQPIKCWRHYLKKVDMQNFEQSDDEVGLLKYFCNNAVVLETICYNSRHFCFKAKSSLSKIDWH